jgi:hypothetical protein
MIILRGGPGADGPRPPLKLPSQPPYNRVSRDLRPRLTCMVCLVATGVSPAQNAECIMFNWEYSEEQEEK